MAQFIEEMSFNFLLQKLNLTPKYYSGQNL